MKALGVLIILSCLVIAGCGYTIMEGKKFDAEKRTEIIKMKTTAAEVVQLIGQPAKIEKPSPDQEKYIYRYYREEYTNWWTLPKIEHEKLEVLLKNGVVQDYSYSEEGRDKITKADR
ncbi:MAG: hypothetical protein ACP5Q3_02960 [bacterium]